MFRHSEHKKALRQARSALRQWLKKEQCIQSAQLEKTILQAAAAKILQTHNLQTEMPAQAQLCLGLLEMPAISRLLAEDCALGSLFEVLAECRRNQATASIQSADKTIADSERAAFSQVFTPPPVVQAILSRCLLEPYLNKATLSLEELQGLKILDPCCGAGNFLIAALRLLVPRYIEFGLTRQAAVQTAIANNLWGLEIDRHLLWLAELALSVESNILAGSAKFHFNLVDVSQNCLGSLDPQLDFFKSNSLFDIIVTNPPYLGRKLLDRVLKAKLKQHYPQCSNDLSQAFLWQAIERCKKGGKIGFLTQSSFLRLNSARLLRQQILSQTAIELIAPLGPGVFPLLSGEKADSAIVILTAGPAPPDFQAAFEDQNNCRRIIYKDQKSLSLSTDLAFNFHRPRAMDCLSQGEILGAQADFKQGLATTDNERFLRYRWELADQQGWVPYAKGGGSERWWKTIETMVLWQEEGRAIKAAVAENYPYLKGKTNWVVKNEEYYFRPGLTFSFISKNRLNVRLLPAGAIFDVGGSAIFSRQENQQENLNHCLFLLAYLNSSLASALARDINPTINFQVGDLKRIAALPAELHQEEQLIDLARQCAAAKQELEMLTSVSVASFSGQHVTISQEDYKKKTNRINELVDKIADCQNQVDELVLHISAQALQLSSADGKEMRGWIEASVLEEKPNSFNLTERLYAAGALALRLAKAAAISPEPISLEAGLACFNPEELQTLHNMVGDPALFIREKLNKYLLEFFSNQPPLFVNTGKEQTATLLCTCRALNDSAYRGHLDLIKHPTGAAVRARDLFRR